MRAADDARAGTYSRNMLRQYSFSDSRTMRRNHHKYHRQTRLPLRIRVHPCLACRILNDRKGRESKIVFVAVCWLFDAAALRFFVPSTGADNTRHACTEEQNRQAGHIL